MNKDIENLKQGTRIEFDIYSFKGKGTIVGIATNEYIIEPDKKLESEIYDYSHFVLWRHQFHAILDTAWQACQASFHALIVHGIRAASLGARRSLFRMSGLRMHVSLLTSG